MSKQIKITITGKHSSGKSVIGGIIAKILKEKGYDVDWEEKVCRDPGYSKEENFEHEVIIRTEEGTVVPD